MPADNNPIPQAAPALLTKRLIRQFYMPLSERTLDRLVSAGKFPRPDLAMGGKIRLWRRECVEEWIAGQAQGGIGASNE